MFFKTLNSIRIKGFLFSIYSNLGELMDLLTFNKFISLCFDDVKLNPNKVQFLGKKKPLQMKWFF